MYVRVPLAVFQGNTENSGRGLGSDFNLPGILVHVCKIFGLLCQQWTQ